MDAILIFNLPEEKQEANRAMSADNLCSFIWEFEQYLRSEAKHADLDGISADEYIDTIRDRWYEMKNEEVSNFNEIWN